MRLIWHVAKNDLRRLWGTIAAYTIFIGAKFLLGAALVRSPAGSLGVFAQFQMFGNLFIGLEVLVGYVVVAAFVHEHPLVGSRASWQTRPISGTQLLIAKLVGVSLVTTAIPLLLSLPYWLAHGYTPADLEQAAAETLLRQSVMLVPALALAVLTDGFDRYVIWLLVLFSAGFLASKLPPVRAAASTPDVAETRQWLALAAGAVTASLVVLNQFLTRRTGRGVALLVVGLAAMATVAWWWPYSFERFRAKPVDLATDAIPAKDIALVFERARIIPIVDRNPELRVGVSVRGLPDELRLRAGSATQRWSWPDAKIDRAGDLNEESFGMTAPALKALGLTPPRMNPAWFGTNADRPARFGMLGQPILPEGLGLSVKTALRPSHLAWIKREPPSYDLTVDFAVFRPEVLAEERLVAGMRLDRGDRHVRVAGFAQTGNLLRVTLVEYSPAINWANPGRYVGTRLAEIDPNVEYFAVNRLRGNAARGEELMVQRARFGTVGITWRLLQFSVPRELISGSWVELPGWFQDLTLAKVTHRRVAELQRSLHLDELRLEK